MELQICFCDKSVNFGEIVCLYFFSSNLMKKLNPYDGMDTKWYPRYRIDCVGFE